MFTTSTETPRDGGSLAGTRETAARVSAAQRSVHCEVCNTPVDMTKTAIIKGHRVLGCPGCDWGALPTARAINVDGVQSA